MDPGSRHPDRGDALQDADPQESRARRSPGGGEATPPIGAVWPGRPYPRGATWDGEGVNFALFSEHAERVELCVFDRAGRHELQRIDVRERTDFV